MLLGDLAVLEKNENGLNDEQITGFGACVAYRFIQLSRISFSLEGRYHLGAADDGYRSLEWSSGVCSIRVGRREHVPQNLSPTRISRSDSAVVPSDP